MGVEIEKFIARLDLNWLLKESETIRAYNKTKCWEIVTIPINVFLEILAKDIVSDISKNIDLGDKNAKCWVNFEDILNDRNLRFDKSFLLNCNEKDKLLLDAYKIQSFFLIYQSKNKIQLNFLRYLNKKIRFIEKSVTNKINSGIQMKLSKWKLGISIDDFNLAQDEIIKHLSVFLTFIYDYQVFLWDDVNFDNKLLLNKNSTIWDMSDILRILSNIHINKNISDKFRNYLEKIIKVLYISIKIFSYLNNIKYDKFLEKLDFKELKFWDLKLEVSSSFSDNDRLSLVKYCWLLLLLVSCIEEMGSMQINKIEEDAFWWLFSNEFLKKLKSSKLKDEFEKIESLDKKRVVLEIVSKKCKLFLCRKNIPFNKLFNYLVWDLSDEKYKSILKFFWENNIEYTEDEYLFILENDLENSLLIENKIFLEKTILWVEKGILLTNIKKLSNEDLDVLITVEDISEVNFLIKYFIEDKNNYKNYNKFVKIIENLKEDLSFLHRFADWYSELEELSKCEFIYIDLESFISEIKSTYKEYNFKEIIIRNKALLSWKNNNIDELNEYYILFNNLDNNILERLLTEIFLLERKYFDYINKVLLVFIWEKNDYEKLLNWWYIELIFKHKDLIDLLLEEDNNGYSLDYLLNEIDKEEWFIITKKNEPEDIYKWLTLYYTQEDIQIIKSKFNNKNDINFLIKIWKLLNGYRTSFIVWLSVNEYIETKTLENIFFVIHFFYQRNIKSFNRAKKIFDIALALNWETDRLEYIENNFENFIYIENPEEFKWVVLKYLKNGDKSIIEKFILDNKRKVNIVANNDLDNYILWVLNNWSDEEKEKLWKSLSKIVMHLLENFKQSILSSTVTWNSWVWTWRSTKLFKQYFLRVLLKKDDETYINYLHRIYKINWKEVIWLKLWADHWRMIIQNLYYSSLDCDYMFFEAFEKFWDIFERFEEIHSNLDIWNLLETSNRLLSEAIETFRREINILS